VCTYLLTLPLLAVSNTQATTVFLWTSSPAQQAYRTLKLIAMSFPFCYTSSGRYTGGRERRGRNDKFPARTHGSDARGPTQLCWTRQDQLETRAWCTKSRRSRLAATCSIVPRAR